jgi:hypothetical protein
MEKRDERKAVSGQLFFVFYNGLLTTDDGQLFFFGLSFAFADQTS